MKIALDFDGTFTRAPHFWHTFVRNAESAGHTVFIVTARCEAKDGIDWNSAYGFDGHPSSCQPPCPVIWCDGKPKRTVAKDIDIWIDDDPYSLVHGSQLTPETLAAWRAQDGYRNPSHRPQDPQGSPDHNRGHRLLSRRARGDSGGVTEG